jgi:predicted CXXCH cytochrome family protein
MNNQTNNNDAVRNDTPWIIAGVIATLVIVLSIPLYVIKNSATQSSEKLMQKEQSSFAGSDSCKECHRPEYEKWQNSDHDKAMDMATDETVLGNFNNVIFTHNGIKSRFFKKDNLFYINTMGPEGTLEDFQITHTFGFSPLQQYLVPFPGGRMQCLTIAWNDVKKEWYALPNHIDDHTDWLHWTGQGQNWNGMCAECHTTGFKKGYDFEKDEFSTSFFEMDVSCEACHGQASRHVAWAKKPEMARESVKNFHLLKNTRGLDAKEFINMCAWCHSRRASIDDFNHSKKDIMDYMIPSLLSDNLYHPDGQILEEVYVYGSFVQSKMYQRNVKCSDCHDVHSQELKVKGNDLCLRCHRADTYDNENHHFHKKTYEGKESDGDDCVRCHMPETTYMGIDKRADHSIRIPQPVLSKTYQIPNACNAQGCHSDKTAQWSVGSMRKWYGLKKRPHFATIIQKGRNGNPDALEGLIILAKDTLSPGIVRATALSLLNAYPENQSFLALEYALSDSDPLIRQTAIATINLLQFDKDARLIFPLLYDPVKAVRIQAALGVVSLQNLILNADQKDILEKVTKEYIETMQYAADFPSGRFNLGLMYDALGKKKSAIQQYKTALKIDAKFIPGLNNLAMLYNGMGKNEEAEKLFKQIINIQPQLYQIVYSLGLLLVEQKKYNEAITYLKVAAGGLPQRPRIHYNLGLLHQFLKQIPEAEAALFKALSLDPESFDFLFALADHYIKTRQIKKAAVLAKRMVSLYPDNKTSKDILTFIEQIEKQTNKNVVK